MNQVPSSWTASLSRAAWTLLLVAVVVYVAWQILRPLLVPLVVLVALIGIVRLAIGSTRRDRW